MATAILGFNRKKLKTEIVDQLPEEGKSGTIYFVPNNIEDEDNNKYDEYIWLKDTKEWELIGVSEIDLENYVTKEALELTNTALFQEPVININQITNNTGGEEDGTRWRVPYAVTKAFQWVNEDPTRQQWYFRPGLKIIFRASDVRDNNGFTGPFITFQYSLIDFSEVNFCNDSNWVRTITEADMNYMTATTTTNGLLSSKDKTKLDNFRKLNTISGSTTVTQTLEPNQFYVFDEVEDLTITLSSTEGYADEFTFQFASGATATSLHLPDSIKWVGDNTIESNKSYIVSICNEVAVLGEISNE